MMQNHSDLALHVVTFLLTTGLVGVSTWLICWRCMGGGSKNASDDYFAGGRSLRWYVVAGSLMLTNLSTEQLVGLNGVVFKDGNLVGIWWEAGAAIAMIFTTTVFLPRYMALGLTTTSSYLGERYDLFARTLVSVVFLVYYTLVLCPLVLYTGALCIRNIFSLEDVPLWAVSLVIGALGACYALAGGLKAVAVSDCLNGIGLIIVGIWVPVAALSKIGGTQALFDEPEYLKPLAGLSQVYSNDSHDRSLLPPSVPWHVTITGLTLNNLYYWSTNQVIVQRVLAAKSLAEGQKGVMFAATMKVVGFTFLCLPGIIGLLLVKKKIVLNGSVFEVAKNDEVYPELVKAVMPSWSLGFFAAVLIGSVLSTYNSALNSASTIFGLEIYKIYINKDASDKRVVHVATAFGALMTLASFFIAPQLAKVDAIFSFLQQMNTVVSLPIVTIFFVGIAASLPDAFAAKIGFVVGAVACGAGQFVPIHYLHVYFCSFLIAAATMALLTYSPTVRKCLGREARPSSYTARQGAALVDMTAWKPLYSLVGGVLAVLVLLIISLQTGSNWLFYTFWILWAILAIALVSMRTENPVAQLSFSTSKAEKEGQIVNPVEVDATVVGADFKGVADV